MPIWTQEQQDDLDNIQANIVAPAAVTYSSKLHIPHYDGEDVTPFVVARFENQWATYRTAIKVNDDTSLLSAFQDCLSGPAKFWASQALTLARTRTGGNPRFDDFYTKFQERFVPALSQAVAQDLLFTIKQKPSESVLLYIDRAATELDAYVEVVKNQVDYDRITTNEVRTKFAATIEVILVHAILRNMHKDLREEIMRAAPLVKTIENLALQARAATLTLNAQPKAAPAAVPLNNATYAIDYQDVDTEIESRLAEIDYLQTRRRQPNRSPLDMSKIKCYKCNKLGHFASRCFTSRASSFPSRTTGPPRMAPFQSSRPSFTRRNAVNEISEIETQMEALLTENEQLRQNLNDLSDTEQQQQTAPNETETNDVNAIDFGVTQQYSAPEDLYSQDF